MKKGKRTSLTTQYVLAIGALLLFTNIVLGVVLLHKSTSAIRALIRKNMLDISNTAAGLLDGDALGALTEEDVGKDAFNDVYAKLAVFQKNIDIEYIYAVRQTGPDEFCFTVDPDPVEPGAFGELVLVTDALREAGRGVAAVDNAPAADRWGNFYSAYSPVFDSKGRVAGIVGVDFNSEWYDRQIRQNTLVVGCLSVLSVLAGALVVLIINRKLRLRFNALREKLSVLSSELDKLTEQISLRRDDGEERTARKELTEGGDQRVSDEMEELGDKIQSMQGEMQRYLSYVHAQAHTDALTQVGNTTAYMELQRQLTEHIQSQSASFGLAVFDINLLKQVNDRCGHTCGDRLIQGAAEVISDVFGAEHTYRIGGDEFIAVADPVTREEMAHRLARVEEQISRFNQRREGQDALSMSMGASVCQPGRDVSFQQVFVRADETMYRQKEEFHRQLGEEYRRYPRLPE